jgi:hypothetical protein
LDISRRNLDRVLYFAQYIVTYVDEEARQKALKRLEDEISVSEREQASEINAKIDAYIKANPKEWNYIQGLPRERLERMLVLQNVNKLERRERVRTSVMKQLDANPELKEAYRKLVKNLPAEQQEKAMTSIAARTLRTITPRQQQQSKGAQV